MGEKKDQKDKKTNMGLKVTQMNYVLCRKNIHMMIAPEKSFSCCKCGESVGVTKATLKQIEKIEEELKPICLECYNEDSNTTTKIMPLTREQIEEIDNYVKNKK